MAKLMQPEDLILISYEDAYQDEEGGFHEEGRVERTITCRSMIYSDAIRAQIRLSDFRVLNADDTPYVGKSIMGTVEIWTVDYHGEQYAIYRGVEVQVEIEAMLGSKTQLILRKRLGNRGDDDRG